MPKNYEDERMLVLDLTVRLGELKKDGAGSWVILDSHCMKPMASKHVIHKSSA